MSIETVSLHRGGGKKQHHVTQNVALNKVNDANPVEGPLHVTDDFLWHRRMKIGMVLNLNTCGELSVKFQQQRGYQGALKTKQNKKISFFNQYNSQNAAFQ